MKINYLTHGLYPILLIQLNFFPKCTLQFVGENEENPDYTLERFTAIFENEENGSLTFHKNGFFSTQSSAVDDAHPKKRLLCHKPSVEEELVEMTSRNFAPLPATHPCLRECSTDPKTRMTCTFKFVLEHRMIMSPADCGRCPQEPMDCLKRNCITADGVRRIVDVVNRQLPGPSIRVCQGDTVVVDVTNEVREETAIHWHGIHMKKTPWMDGVPRVTQCPIPRDRSFRYEFEVPLGGTYFWHSHAGFQRGDGIFGTLIVRKPINTEVHGPLQGKLYDFDLPQHEMVVMDWQKRETMNVLLRLQFAGDDFRPNNALINGKGLPHNFFNETTEMVPLHEVRVSQGSSYRFRLISNGIMSCPLEMSIEDHRMTVIATDGFDLQPTTVNSLVLYAGERWDVIVRADQPIGSYWIKFRGLNVCAGGRARVYQLAVLNYEGISRGTMPTNFIKSWQQAGPPAGGIQLNPVNAGPANDRLTVAQLSSLMETDDDDPEVLTREKVDHQFYLAYDFNPIENLLFTHGQEPGHVANVGGRLYIPQVNQISHFPPSSPPLTQPESIPSMNLCRRNADTGQFEMPNLSSESGGAGRNCSTEFCACTHMLKVKLGSIVEVVLVDQANTLNANHPWHLHGHSFRVIAMDRVNRSTSLEEVQEFDKKNLINRRRSNAPIKDTVTVPAGGYTIFRFRADNAGFWFFHCHVEFHVEVGMALIIQVGETSEMLKSPENFPTCGTHQNRQSNTKPSEDSESCKTGQVMKLLGNRGLSPFQTYSEVTYANYRHIFVQSPMLSWEDAAEACRSICGELAGVRTTVDLENVKQTLSNVTWAWLGGRRSEDGQNFKWTGRKDEIPAFFWGHGEPNNAGGRENCVNIFVGWSGGNDYTCSYEIPFICQVPLSVTIGDSRLTPVTQEPWLFFHSLLGVTNNIPATLLTTYKPSGTERVVSVTNHCGRNRPLKLTCASNEETVGPFYLNDKDGIIFKFDRAKNFWCDLQWYDRWQVFSFFEQEKVRQEWVTDFRIYGNIIGNKGGVYVGTSLWKLWA